ncbi:MAG: prepilin-type N-terminal cleavage/methylation domain-containing protein [Lachnospiraceae bacterium]|nr:prepilin-type N-terminal cleavage/methylation domain-containing protein [Lachnospiraceae bacterium]
MKKFKKQSKNNKGFSLVELIIVVAIMAILVGILAPQYVKYVERSRQSADLSNMQNLVQALKVANSDGLYVINDGVYTIKMTTTGTTISSTDTATDYITAINEYTEETFKKVGEENTNITLKSSRWNAKGSTGTGGTKGTISATINISGDSFKVTYDPTDLMTSGAGN